jgi:hypothetical protein
MSFFYFLLKNLTMQQVYGSWYLQDGFKIGLIEAGIIALVFVILFYYVWAYLKNGSLKTYHWVFIGIVNALVTLGVTFLTGRSLLLKYVAANSLETYQPGCSQLITSCGAIDLWLFATNSVIWGVVFYFIISIILKRWSIYWNIPFGIKHKNRKSSK